VFGDEVREARERERERNGGGERKRKKKKKQEREDMKAQRVFRQLQNIRTPHPTHLRL
jgi:hypothetical protein